MTPITTEQIVSIIQQVGNIIDTFKLPIIFISGVYLGIYIIQEVILLFTGKRVDDTILSKENIETTERIREEWEEATGKPFPYK